MNGYTCLFLKKLISSTQNISNTSSSNVDEKIVSVENTVCELKSQVNGIEDKINAMLNIMSRFK